MGLLFVLPIKRWKSKGWIVKATKTAERIPIIETTEIVYKTGCLANINAPIPRMVVITDKIIDVRCVESTFSPVRYSVNSPLVMKMQ